MAEHVTSEQFDLGICEFQDGGGGNEASTWNYALNFIDTVVVIGDLDFCLRDSDIATSPNQHIKDPCFPFFR